MTSNQIEYQKLLETRRANQAKEALTARQTEGTLAYNYANLSEVGRHNKQAESIALGELGIKQYTAPSTVALNEQKVAESKANEAKTIAETETIPTRITQGWVSEAADVIKALGLGALLTKALTGSSTSKDDDDKRNDGNKPPNSGVKYKNINKVKYVARKDTGGQITVPENNSLQSPAPEPKSGSTESRPIRADYYNPLIGQWRSFVNGLTGKNPTQSSSLGAALGGSAALGSALLDTAKYISIW